MVTNRRDGARYAGAAGVALAAGQGLDHQPQPGMRPNKRRSDQLIALAEQWPDLAVGYEDETWWSCLAHPALHTWTDDGPLRLVAHAVAKVDPDPKALACYGLLVRQDAAPVAVPNEVS